MIIKLLRLFKKTQYKCKKCKDTGVIRYPRLNRKDLCDCEARPTKPKTIPIANYQIK